MLAKNVKTPDRYCALLHKGDKETVLLSPFCPGGKHLRMELCHPLRGLLHALPDCSCKLH